MWKRYSDFRQFDKQLRDYLKARDPVQLKLLPTLPPKKREINAGMDVRPNSKGYRLLQERMIGLQRYLRGVHFDFLAQPIDMGKSRDSLAGLRPFLDLETAARLML